jgi:hypothetical protein
LDTSGVGRGDTDGVGTFRTGGLPGDVMGEAARIEFCAAFLVAVWGVATLKDGCDTALTGFAALSTTEDNGSGNRFSLPLITTLS